MLALSRSCPTVSIGGNVSTLDWAVIAGAIAAILWVNWYFFLAERREADLGPADGRRSTPGREVAPR